MQSRTRTRTRAHSMTTRYQTGWSSSPHPSSLVVATVARHFGRRSTARARAGLQVAQLTKDDDRCSQFACASTITSSSLGQCRQSRQSQKSNKTQINAAGAIAHAHRDASIVVVVVAHFSAAPSTVVTHSITHPPSSTLIHTHALQSAPPLFSRHRAAVVRMQQAEKLN